MLLAGWPWAISRDVAPWYDLAGKPGLDFKQCQLHAVVTVGLRLGLCPDGRCNAPFVVYFAFIRYID